jgi:8-oxo-dGTP diphosphatase
MPSNRGSYCYDYPRPLVSVDAVVFRERDGELEVLLVRRGKPPFEGMCALPGGFVEMHEDLHQAASRELREETGLEGVDLRQLAAFGRPDRDPRGRCISIAFVGALERGGDSVRGGDDAAEASWHGTAELPALAFDHDEIVAHAIANLARETT